MSNHRTRALTAYTAGTRRNRMTMERQLRHLGEAGLLPRGLPGRRSEVYEVIHHANIIESLAGDQPSDGPEAVRVLDGLVCTTNGHIPLPFDLSRIPVVREGTPFKSWLIQEIEDRVAGLGINYTHSDPEKAPFVEPMQINMSVNPPRVVVWRPLIGEDGQPVIDRYLLDEFRGPDPKALIGENTPPYYRQTIITAHVLNVAATLLIETRAKQATAPIPSSVPGRTGEGDDATPETTKAAGSGNHDGLVTHQPASASASASRTSASRTHRQRQPKISQGSKQLSFAVSTDHEGDRVRDAGSSTRTRRRFHDLAPHHHAPA